jgi:arsenite methyltransferase
MSCCGTTRARSLDAGIDEGEEVRSVVRTAYGAAARRAAAGERANCCGTESAADADPITADLYGADESGAVPEAALRASLGCGNPTALARLEPGETVLDLGSGGGIDVLLSARRVGPTGFAYGLDMTDEMLELARENARRAGATNVEFLRGEIEAIPLADASVDVIISNCVINLAADKGHVLREAFRVLRPGGRFAVSDVVARDRMSDVLRADARLWAACVSGALEEGEYRRLLADAGFEGIEIESTREYRTAELIPAERAASLPETGLVFGAFVRARKPG